MPFPVGGIGLPELLIILVIGVISLITTVFWIWMLIDCVTKETGEGNDKLVWTVVIALTGWIGALIYLFVRRPERIRTLGA